MWSGSKAARWHVRVCAQVVSLAFGESGAVFFRSRYVRTPTFEAEQASQGAVLPA